MVKGWSYECVLSKLRFEKMCVNNFFGGTEPVITVDNIEKNGIAMVTFNNLVIKTRRRVNG